LKLNVKISKSEYILTVRNLLKTVIHKRL